MMVQAGRVELVEFHVRHPASRPPRHGDAVAGAAARVSRITPRAAGATGGEDRGAAGEQIDPPAPPVDRIDAPDAILALAVGDRKRTRLNSSHQCATRMTSYP